MNLNEDVVFTPSVIKLIEKDINEEIIKRLKLPYSLAVSDMKKDIPRMTYCIEGRRVRCLDRFISVASKQINTRWLIEHIVEISFAHQGLYQILMNRLNIVLAGERVRTVGLDNFDSFFMFDFSTRDNKKYVNMCAGGNVSAIVTTDNIYMARRDKSNVNISLSLEFIPGSSNFFRTTPASVKVMKRSPENRFHLAFDRYSSPIMDRRVF